MSPSRRDFFRQLGAAGMVLGAGDGFRAPDAETTWSEDEVGSIEVAYTQGARALRFNGRPLGGLAMLGAALHTGKHVRADGGQRPKQLQIVCQNPPR